MSKNDKQVKLGNLKANCEINIDNYQHQIDMLTLSAKEVEKLRKKIAKQDKKLKELESMIWVYEVGDVVLFKDDLREVKITELVNFVVNGKRHIYYGDFKNGSANVAFCQDELIAKPCFDSAYIDLLQKKIRELKSEINNINFRR